MCYVFTEFNRFGLVFINFLILLSKFKLYNQNKYILLLLIVI